jgi:hypothetical protein
MTYDRYRKLRSHPATPPEEICGCIEETPIVLQGNLSPNPLACARCNLEVPPERLGLAVPFAEAVAAWARFHRAFMTLWLDSGEYEEWAAAQLGDAASPVVLRGLALVQRLNESRRCYLWWFVPDDEHEDAPAPQSCPRCAQALELRFPGERPQSGSLRVCERCSIAIAV